MRTSKILHAATNTMAMVLLLNWANFVNPVAVQGQTHSRTKSPMKPAEKSDALSAFLAIPINLISFKKKKGSSNSGSLKVSRWIYRPKEPGFFYQYKLFLTPARYGEGKRFRGFSVVVYKFGKEIGDYHDNNETLVAIWCRLRDPDLGQADLVGRSVSDINVRFGEPFAVVENVLIYHRHGRALSVHIKDGAVDWFKYVRLRRDIDAPGAVPELLLQSGSGW